ncbi:MAG: hypothetical protein IJ861_01555 [Clostridia bacterium]|nr:hypothetical protein [Clostridia bacterium]
MKEEKKISDTNHTEVYPKPKKKKKKLLITPSQIIRWFMIGFYALAVFLLSTQFVTATMFIADDLEVTADTSKYYTKLSDQEELDAAAKNLSKAIDGLKKAETEDSEEESKADEEQPSKDELSVATANFDWHYQVSSGVNADELIGLINKSRSIDRTAYTEESVSELNKATLEAQKALCATVTISQAALQFILTGSSGGNSVTSDISNSLLMYALGILPLVGFFIASFDRNRHIKNIYTLLCSAVCIFIIFKLIYPYVATGSVISIFVYIALFCLSVGGFYAKQQEDYIIRHPEDEPEFTAKHPQFLKALLNEKTISIIDKTEQEKVVEAAKNAKKKGRRKK